MGVHVSFDPQRAVSAVARTPPVDPLASRAHTGTSLPYFLANCRFENSNATHIVSLRVTRVLDLGFTCVKATVRSQQNAAYECKKNVYTLRRRGFL